MPFAIAVEQGGEIVPGTIDARGIGKAIIGGGMGELRQPVRLSADIVERRVEHLANHDFLEADDAIGTGEHNLDLLRAG